MSSSMVRRAFVPLTTMAGSSRSSGSSPTPPFGLVWVRPAVAVPRSFIPSVFRRPGSRRCCAMPSFERLAGCRVCGGTDLSIFLSLGETPLANSFVRPQNATARELRVPLEVMRCQRCGLAQLTVVVDPEVMFRDYAYATSASAPMRGHFETLAKELAERFAPRGSLVVEIGSN